MSSYAEDEQHTRTSFSNAGSSFTSQTIADWRPSQAGTIADVNAQRPPKKPTNAGYDGHSGPLHSNLDEVSPPSQSNLTNAQSGKEPPELHSGPIAPMNVPPQGHQPTIHGQILDAHAYDDAVPINPLFTHWSCDKKFGLEILKGQEYVRINHGALDKVIAKKSFSDIKIGRDTNSDIIINHEATSRTHCVIGQDGISIFIGDANSRNGTYVNDEKVDNINTKKYYLADGDKIRIAGIVLRVHIKTT